MIRTVPLLFLLYLGNHLFAQAPADTLLYCQYNLMYYGNSDCGSLATRNGHFKTIFNQIRPDILTVNEMRPTATAINSLKNNALIYNPQMQATTYGNVAQSDMVNMLYYNSAKLGYLGHQVITGNVRDVDVHRLYDRQATNPGDTLDFYCILAHFKSSTGTQNVAARAETALDIATWLKDHPQVRRYFLSGDLNLYSSSEPAWQTLVLADNWFEDPAEQPQGWVGPSFTKIHTQSPADGTALCSVTGGMDDRFDFILVSPDIYAQQSRIACLSNTYRAFGNDGVSYNKSLQCSSTASIPAEVCAALQVASDHLPVVMQLSFQASQVSTGGPSPFSCKILGNPVTDYLRLQCPDLGDAPASWKIIDQYGRTLQTGKIATNNHNLLEISTHWLKPGLYVLMLESANTKVEIVRFVRQ